MHRPQSRVGVYKLKACCRQKKQTLSLFEKWAVGTGRGGQRGKERAAMIDKHEKGEKNVNRSEIPLRLRKGAVPSEEVWQTGRRHF